MGKKHAGLGAYAVAGFFVLLPPLAVGGALALAPLQGILGVLAAPLRAPVPRSWSARLFLLFLLGFLCWLAVSVLWSPYPDPIQALKTPAGYLCGLLFASGAAATAENRRLVRAVGVAALIVLGALLCIEALAQLPLNRLGQPEARLDLLARNPMRGAAALMVMVWASVAALAGGGMLERYGWILLLALAGTASAQFGMDANMAAFALGLCGYIFGFCLPRLALIGTTLGWATWLLAAPWIVLHAPIPADMLARLPDSWAHRLGIWRFAAEHIQRQPWFGWGLDASRTFDQRMIVDGRAMDALPLHPHSFSLQVWLELGAVGAALGALALIAGGLAAARLLASQRIAAAGAAGVIMAFGVLANLSFGAWQEWWTATAFAAAALVAASFRASADEASAEA